MNCDDKRDDETWPQYWRRKHDERHGAGCRCLWVEVQDR